MCDRSRLTSQFVSEVTANKLEDKTDIIKIKYKNFGGSGPFETTLVEDKYHDAVAYYRAGLLSFGIDATTKTFKIRRPVHSDDPYDNRPDQAMQPSGVDGNPYIQWSAETPGGLVASTSTDDMSVINANTGHVTKYVTWLRLGNEYMKIVKVVPDDAEVYLPNGTYLYTTKYPDAVVTVERGHWGSMPQAHAENTTTLAPIYHAAGCHPKGGGSCLRYAWDPAQPYVADYLAEAYEPLYDGLWLDCFGVDPHFASNAIGEDMHKFMWNVSGNVRYSHDGYVAAQRMLVERVRAKIAIKGATHLYANNVDRWESGPVLLSPGTLLDGGAKESFAIRVHDDELCGYGTGDPVLSPNAEVDWMSSMRQVMNLSAAGLPTMPIIGDAGCRSPQLVRAPNREELEDFGYASFLLAAGTRTSMYGIVPYYFRNATKGHTGGVFIKIHPRYFYPIGAPMQTKGYLAGQSSFQSMDLEGYRVAPCTFARLFETALVLVNPTAHCSDASVPLNGTWYDPAAGPASQPITTVAMAPGKGRILLRWHSTEGAELEQTSPPLALPIPEELTNPEKPIPDELTNPERPMPTVLKNTLSYVEKLNNAQDQLTAVEAALEQDPTDDELLKLKSNLLEVIMLEQVRLELALEVTDGSKPKGVVPGTLAPEHLEVGWDHLREAIKAAAGSSSSSSRE